MSFYFFVALGWYGPSKFVLPVLVEPKWLKSNFPIALIKNPNYFYASSLSFVLTILSP